MDFTDLLVFPKPGDPSKSTVIMNMHPSFGLNPPGPTTDEPFAPEGLYELRVDTNGDMVADIAYRVRFLRNGNGKMTATVRRAEGQKPRVEMSKGKLSSKDCPSRWVARRR